MHPLAVQTHLRPHMVCPVDGQPAIETQRRQDEREAIRPLAAATVARLEQARRIVVPREAGDDVTTHAAPSLHARAAEAELLLLGLGHAPGLGGRLATTWADGLVRPAEEIAFEPLQQLLHGALAATWGIGCRSAQLLGELCEGGSAASFVRVHLGLCAVAGESAFHPGCRASVWIRSTSCTEVVVARPTTPHLHARADAVAADVAR
mmetsp:Transcript_38988/g.125270  ORF Transcript_38988/g.125270 Transcript_38988/m.125270 type:complete len:207 (-) Transcript_38988:189-809(-)